MLLQNPEEFQADVAALPAEGVVHPDSIAAGVNPAAAFEVSQVAGNGGLRQLEDRHQITDAQFSFGLQQEDDPQADRVGKGFDGLGEMFHDSPISKFRSSRKTSTSSPAAQSASGAR